MPILERIHADKGELVLSDKLTFADSNDYRKKLFSLFDSKVKSIAVNLSGLSFMDSAGLGMLMVALKECQQRGIILTLHQPRDGVKTMLNLSKSYDRFTILD